MSSRSSTRSARSSKTASSDRAGRRPSSAATTSGCSKAPWTVIPSTDSSHEAAPAGRAPRRGRPWPPSRRAGSRSPRTVIPESACHGGGSRPNATSTDSIRFVSRERRPAPGAGRDPTASPSTPPGSTISSPSICRPPQMPSTRVPRRAAAAIASPSPRSPEPGEVGGNVLRAGQDDEVGPVEVVGASRPDELRDLLQGLELVEVRRGRVAHGRHPRSARSTPAAPRRRPRPGARGRRTGAGRRTASPSSRSRSSGAGASRLSSPRNLFSTNPRRSSRSSFGHERPRSVQVRERAAAVDVRDEHDGRVGRMRGAHVGEVGGAEVGLGRAPRALEQHELVLREQAPQRLCRDRPERRRPLAPGAAAELVVDPAEEHELAAIVRLGLDEDRVHAHVGLDPRRERLQVLRDADLAAVDDASVVGHVLRLERRDPHAAAAERASEGGDDEALAREAGDALDRQRAQRVGSRVCGGRARGNDRDPAVQAHDPDRGVVVTWR